jgi:ketosteroid isomerase-like protein
MASEVRFFEISTRLVGIVLASALLVRTTAATAASEKDGCAVKPAALPTERLSNDMRTKNIADVMTLYDDRAAFVDPDGTQYRGRAALYSLYERVFATLDTNIVMVGREWRSTAARACIENGQYKEDLRVRPTGTTHHYEGNYSITYKRQSDGVWRISRQEWTK